MIGQEQTAITVLGDNVCRACSKNFGTGANCPSCRSLWQSQGQIFDNNSFADLPSETLEALKRLQDYEIPSGIISRLAEKPPYNTMTGQQILERTVEFKKFMGLLVINYKKKRRIEMVSDEIDEIWHTFILFTREYQSFCNLLVGEHIHHEPNVQNDNSELCAIRNYPLAGIRNFNEDYQRYFGKLSPVWDSSDGEGIRKQEIDNSSKSKRKIAFAVTMSMNGILVSFLVQQLLTYGTTIALLQTAAAYLPLLAGGVLWSRFSKDTYNKRMVGAVVILTFAALLGTATVFVLWCQFDDEAKKFSIVGFVALFLLSSGLFARFREKPGKKYKNASKSRCGGGSVGVACGSGGAGCGGGGCGGGGC